jgi:hypothetical protein
VERLRRTIGSMRTFQIVVGAALVAITLAATPGRAALTWTSGGALRATSSSPAAEYSAAVTRICAGALLFDGLHQMGTRSDALSIAHDIRASTARRLTRVADLSIPPELNRISRRWISSQHRLAALYARTWVSTFDAIDAIEEIDAARTPPQRAALAERLEDLVHAPDALRLAAGRLEVELHVPDCTGGG